MSEPCMQEMLRDLGRTIAESRDATQRLFGVMKPKEASEGEADGNTGHPGPASAPMFSGMGSGGQAGAFSGFASSWREFVPEFRRFASAFGKPAKGTVGATASRTSIAGGVPAVGGAAIADASSPASPFHGLGRLFAKAIGSAATTAFQRTRLAGAGLGDAGTAFPTMAKMKRAWQTALDGVAAGGSTVARTAQVAWRTTQRSWQAGGAARVLDTTARTAGHAWRGGVKAAAAFGGAVGSPFVAGVNAGAAFGQWLGRVKAGGARFGRAVGAHPRWVAAMAARRAKRSAIGAFNGVGAAARRAASSFGRAGNRFARTARVTAWKARRAFGRGARAAGAGLGRVASAAGMAGGRGAAALAGIRGGPIALVVEELVRDGLKLGNAMGLIAENVNNSNRRFARYNPAIGAAHMMTDMGDFRRNILMGRSLQDVTANLAANVNRMRDAWQGFDEFKARGLNLLGHAGAGVSEAFGRSLSKAFEGINAWMKANDPNGDVMNQAGRVLGAGLGAIATGNIFGVFGAMKAEAARPVPPPVLATNPWGQAMHDIVRQGPLRRPRRVPDP